MSDEESFVILGTSPTPSIDLSIPEVSPAKPLTQHNGSIKTNAIIDSQLTSSSSSNASHFSIVHNGDSVPPAATTTSNGNCEINAGLMADCVDFKEEKFTEKPSIDAAEAPASNTMKHSYSSNSSVEGSLATRFIFGEINSDVLKSSVYSQFPNFCSMGACAEDVVKLQNLMSEYIELKKTLINTNLTMKQLYNQTQKWKNDAKASEDEHRAEIAKLRNENLELRRDLEIKAEQISLNEEARRKDHEEFVRSLSEKSAQIENMSAQIQKLERQQLATFEIIPKNATETTQSKDSIEYVTTLEHRQVIKKFETQMSVLVAENLQLKDMQAQYIDEINCLKVNLVSAEELIKKAEADINFLKATDMEKSEMFTSFESERKALREDIEVLRHQVDIYSREFKTEQEARENLANEKDQLLTDLRELQRKNQELIQETHRNYEEHARQVMGATGAFPKTRAPAALSASSSPRSSINPIYTPTNYNCPLCGQIFKTLSVLQIHVNQCLDGN